MDVSIKPSDKQAREAFIKARDDKQGRAENRAKRRQNRKDSRRNTVVERRLRRRIRKAVRTHLRAERRNYLRGEATGGKHVIDADVQYKGGVWFYKRAFVENILTETFAKHAGFEYKADFRTDEGKDEWCHAILIWYTLLEH
jgi:hypothetical protein